MLTFRLDFGQSNGWGSTMKQTGQTPDSLTHVDPQGNAWMVDVSGKESTVRQAVAIARISMSHEAASAIRENALKKGDALGVARIAAIQDLIAGPYMLHSNRIDRNQVAEWD